MLVMLKIDLVDLLITDLSTTLHYVEIHVLNDLRKDLSIRIIPELQSFRN